MFCASLGLALPEKMQTFLNKRAPPFCGACTFAAATCQRTASKRIEHVVAVADGALFSLRNARVKRALRLADVTHRLVRRAEHEPRLGVGRVERDGALAGGDGRAVRAALERGLRGLLLL